MMNGSENQGDRDFSMYDALDTEELNEILRIYFDAEGEEEKKFDEDAILYVMEVVARREMAAPSGRFTEVSAAWKSFEKNYLPFLSDTRPLECEDEDEEDEQVTDRAEAQEPDRQPPLPLKTAEHSARKPRKALRTILVAAALLVALVIGGSLAASAMGYDLRDVVVQWTKETLSFGLPEVAAENPAATLKAEHHVDRQLIPTWIPEEYQYEGTAVMEIPEAKVYEMTYTRPAYERPMVIRIKMLSRLEPGTFEKDEDLVVEHMAGGINHYIFSNEDRRNVMWMNGACECSITGAFSISDAERMIDSIYGSDTDEKN